MIEPFPFAGFPVAVLGLGPEGMASARGLLAAGAEVWAWDDDESRRAAAEEIPLRDLTHIDWREPVSLIIEYTLAHGKQNPHFLVAKARAVGCEVIADSELLGRTQRDAGFVAIVSRSSASPALDLFGHVFSVSGRETEAGGDAARPLMKLYPLDLGGIYVIDMPPARAELTPSITFDAAVLLDFGTGPWPPCLSREETVTASRWVFQRQAGPRGAVVNVDDAEGRRTYEDLTARAEQVVIPISGRSRAPNGVYVAGGVLYDDLGGRDEAITDLPVSGETHAAKTPLLAAAVYAAAVMVDIPKHAAMASLRGFFAG